jgi:hypothetical protein
MIEAPGNGIWLVLALLSSFSLRPVIFSRGIPDMRSIPIKSDRFVGAFLQVFEGISVNPRRRSSLNTFVRKISNQCP